jgi:hypothetical protein
MVGLSRPRRSADHQAISSISGNGSDTLAIVAVVLGAQR